MVGVLMHFSYIVLVNSSKVKISEYRGRDIICKIFSAIADVDKDGYKLLPEDYQLLYNRVDQTERQRVICDFIAGMTDRYALEFYCRLYSENPATIFKPL